MYDDFFMYGRRPGGEGREDRARLCIPGGQGPVLEGSGGAMPQLWYHSNNIPMILWYYYDTLVVIYRALLC